MAATTPPTPKHSSTTSERNPLTVYLHAETVRGDLFVSEPNPTDPFKCLCPFHLLAPASRPVPQNGKKCTLCKASCLTVDAVRRHLGAAHSPAPAASVSTTCTIALIATLGASGLWFCALHRHVPLAVNRKSPQSDRYGFRFQPCFGCGPSAIPSYPRPTLSSLRLPHTWRLLPPASACPTAPPTLPSDPRRTTPRPRPRRQGPSVSPSNGLPPPAFHHPALPFRHPPPLHSPTRATHPPRAPPSLSEGAIPCPSSHPPPPPACPASLVPDLPGLGAICRTRMPIVEHISTRLRRPVREVFTAALRELVSASSDVLFLRAYTKLALHPAAVLSPPPSRSGFSLPPLVTHLKNSLNRWHNREYRALWDQAVAARYHAPYQPHSCAVQRSRNVKRALRIAPEMAFGWAIQALQSGGVHSPTPDVMAALLAEHPQSTPDTDGTHAFSPDSPDMA